MMAQILYDENYDRLVLGDKELHCDDILQVMVPQGADFAWQTVSLKNNGSSWYFPELPSIFPVGLWAKPK